MNWGQIGDDFFEKVSLERGPGHRHNSKSRGAGYCRWTTLNAQSRMQESREGHTGWSFEDHQEVGRGRATKAGGCGAGRA